MLSQTLLSTDIIHFSTDASGKVTRTFAPAAVWLFVIITVPLMLLTFLGSALMGWLERKRGKGERKQEAPS